MSARQYQPIWSRTRTVAPTEIKQRGFRARRSELKHRAAAAAAVLSGGAVKISIGIAHQRTHGIFPIGSGERGQHALYASRIEFEHRTATQSKASRRAALIRGAI